MLVHIKEDKECASCRVVVTPKDEAGNKNSLYKTKEGALVCKECFFDSDEED